MWIYILKRLLLMIPTLLGVLTLTFVVIQFVPGGPVEQMQHELRKGAEGGAPFGLRSHSGVDAQQLAQLKQLYGFDKPPLERYVLMLKRFSTFDLGQSYFRHQSVWSLIVSKLPVSISIGLWTFFLTYLISVPLGIAKAVRNGSRFDIATSLVVLIGYAIPGFVLGVLLLVLFGARGPLGAWLERAFGIELIFTRNGAALATAVMSFPLMVRTMRISLESVDRGLEDAARTLGAGALDRFATITLPLMLPGVLAGAITAFSAALGEFGAVITFVSNIPGETRTLPLALYTALQTPGGDSEAARLAAISCVLGFSGLLLSEWFARRVRRMLGR